MTIISLFPYSLFCWNFSFESRPSWLAFIVKSVFLRRVLFPECFHTEECMHLCTWMSTWQGTIFLSHIFSPFSSVHFSHSVVSDSLWPHEPQHPRPPCPTQLLESTQTHVHWVGDAIQHLILCCPLLLLPSIFPSIRVFSNESNESVKCPCLT